MRGYVRGVATLTLDVDACTGCGMCVTVCPHRVLTIRKNRAHIQMLDDCMECGACAVNCPTGAVRVNPGVGCVYAVILGWLKGSDDPTCECCAGERDDCPC